MTSQPLPLNLNVDPIIALNELCELYPEQVVFTTSLGLEDQALTDLIARNNIKVRLATLDTGRLFPESYSLLDRTRAKYDIDIKSYFPDTLSLEEFVNENGMNSIYNSIYCRKTCCKIRKIDPLFRALEGAQIWVTGLRADQSDNRATLPRIEKDSFTGLVKFNPLVDWNDLQLHSYLNSHSVPTNTLHRKGYPSIGCEPCTRAITTEEHPRAGRWWWENSSQECGLHKG
jgi:phosphoadenosine phosphosulfate reductase